MKIKLSFGDGCDLDTLQTMFGGLVGYNLRLTIGGRPQDVRLDAVGTDPLGNYAFLVTFYTDKECNELGETKFVQLENLWEIHIY